MSKTKTCKTFEEWAEYLGVIKFSEEAKADLMICTGIEPDEIEEYAEDYLAISANWQTTEELRNYAKHNNFKIATECISGDDYTYDSEERFIDRERFFLFENVDLSATFSETVDFGDDECNCNHETDLDCECECDCHCEG